MRHVNIYQMTSVVPYEQTDAREAVFYYVQRQFVAL